MGKSRKTTNDILMAAVVNKNASKNGGNTSVFPYHILDTMTTM